jgi:serine/threonine-protein kinase
MTPHALPSTSPGTVIDARYLVLRRIGVGGSATVYRARDLVVGGSVAVKVLHEWFADDAEAIGRFRGEAARMAGLHHPNLVSVRGDGDWDGRPYIALEYVAGGSLARLIARRAPLAPARAIELAAELLLGVRHVHGRGIVHRDLKPDNVMVGDDGRLKLTDFGIACASDPDLTQTGGLVGTVRYMSPEQAEGERVGPASDLYSLGVILYELLTGHVPFEAETVVAAILRQLREPPSPPSTLNPAVTPALDAIVLRALRKRPDDRFRDADAFLRALERVRATPASEQAELACAGDHAGAGGDAELAPQSLGVRAHRVHRHVQVVGHLAVGEIARQQSQHP